MAAATETPAGGQPFAKGSLIWEKKGPLPVWAWALLVLGLVLAVSMWRRNSSSSKQPAAVTSPGNVPPNGAAPPVFIMPQGPAPNVTITNPECPPGGGRPAPPGTPPPPPADNQPSEQYAVAYAGDNVNDWFSGWGISDRYDEVQKLNPTVYGQTGAEGLMSNTNSHPDHSQDTFKSTYRYRIR